MRKQSIGIALIAAATLLLESTLLRLMAVSQYYHFAFLIISLALLGFGASGSFLSLASKIEMRSGWVRRLKNGPELLIFSGIMFSISVAVSYGVVNLLPFDSYSIAWERRQIVFFIIYYLVLTLPFFFSGLCIGGCLAIYKGRSHIIYAANLIGSGGGVLLAPVFLELAGVLGAILVAIIIGLLATSMGFSGREDYNNKIKPTKKINIKYITIGVFVIVIGAGVGYLSSLNMTNRSPIGLVISPYKGLAHARRYPGSEEIFGKWNAISRIDIVARAGTRQLPGLSYVYTDPPPEQYGISVDGESVQPITLVEPVRFKAAYYLPETLSFLLSDRKDVLVIEPAGGLGILQALAYQAQDVIAVIDNPLVVSSVENVAADYSAYSYPNVSTIIEYPRIYIGQTKDKFDLLFIPLTQGYKPVTSGAYSLSEEYNLTVEAFQAYIDLLKPGGILVVSRWLQTPASESLKMAATIAEALRTEGDIDPSEAIVAFRGIQIMTEMVKPDSWSEDELDLVRDFIGEMKYDLVWSPDITPDEINKSNVLPEEFYYESFSELLHSNDTQEFYSEYPFAIEPATDDRPFFYHFFTWNQTPEILKTIGQTWQPFGGSGYLVLIALFILVVVFSFVLIVMPLLLNTDNFKSGGPSWKVLIYFSLLGLGFLLIEIPLIQHTILMLGNPTYAFTVVVFALLTFSSIGSLLARSERFPWIAVMGLLIFFAIGSPWLITKNAGVLQQYTFWGRATIIGVSLAPLGILMGIPFPFGLARLEERWAGLVPWAWAVNGCASVIAAVLAAILTLSYGYQVVLLCGAAAYLLAFLMFPRKWNKTNWT